MAIVATPTDRQTGVQLDTVLGNLNKPGDAAASLREFDATHRKISNAGEAIAQHLDSEARRMSVEVAKLKGRP